MKLLILSLLACVLYGQGVESSEDTFARLFETNGLETYYEWKKVEYKFANDDARKTAIANKTFIQANCAITVAKTYGDRMYLTTPRYKQGIPATLSSVQYGGFFEYFRKRDPVLEPFPSWEMNKEGNCSAFQLVQAFEIDQFGRLWIVDVGRTNILGATPNNLCPAKLVIMDLTANNRIVKTYTFPDDVVSGQGNALKDINVACPNKTDKMDCFAYISDIFGNKVIVFDNKNSNSWSASHPSMAPKDQYVNFAIAGTNTSAPFGVAGSALSPFKQNFDRLYYSPIADIQIYVVNTTILKNAKANIVLTDQQVNSDFFNRKKQSDGWAMDNKGKLYYGGLPDNSVNQLQTTDPKEKRMSTQRFQSNDTLQWPDTFGFDNKGYLLFTSNKFQLYDDAKYNFDEINFRVLRFKTDSKAYSFA